MLQKRRQRHAERLCQLAHSSRPAAKPFEHRSSRRVGETVEHAIQLGCLLVRHTPYYTVIEYLGQYLTVQTLGKCQALVRQNPKCNRVYMVRTAILIF